MDAPDPTEDFLGFVYLGCICILLRSFLAPSSPSGDSSGSYLYTSESRVRVSSILFKVDIIRGSRGDSAPMFSNCNNAASTTLEP